MDIFIRGLGNISPQHTIDNNVFLDEIAKYDTNHLQCIHPEYKQYINPVRLRRMSKMIKMGVAAAKICLQDAKVEMPGAVITGTGFGCTGDTEKFLLAMLENNEESLPPTAFMQSTHNTISGQVAISLGCNAYNSTYVNRGTSFEAAIQDGMMLMNDGEAESALIGGFDECTDNHYLITGRLGYWKEKDINNMELLDHKSTGSISGEGAIFFLLSNNADEENYARLKGVSTFYKPQNFEEVENRIVDFLSAHGHNPSSIDLVITGMNGDVKRDEVYHHLKDGCLSNSVHTYYKHLCGEYDVASSFAMWMGANMIKRQSVPKVVNMGDEPKGPINTLLIYNHHNYTNHGLLLLEKC